MKPDYNETPQEQEILGYLIILFSGAIGALILYAIFHGVTKRHYQKQEKECKSCISQLFHLSQSQEYGTIYYRKIS